MILFPLYFEQVITFWVVYAQMERLSTWFPQNLCLVKETLNNIDHNHYFYIGQFCLWVHVSERVVLQALDLSYNGKQAWKTLTCLAAGIYKERREVK